MNRSLDRRHGALICFWMLSAGLFQPTFGATVAYWRHEEGPAGSLISDGPDTVRDSSGNDNHMQTFAAAFTPYTSATYTTDVSPAPLRSGLANQLALDFGFGSDGVAPEGAEPNDDNYAFNKPINVHAFTALTVEVAFKMKSIGGFQALVGKDGKPLGDAEGEPDSPVPPLKLMVRGDDFPDAVPNQLFVEWIDGDGDVHFLANGETIAADAWHHVAFTVTNSDAQLWVADRSGSYALKDSITGEDFAGTSGRVLIEEPLGFTVGRGMFNNGVTDWSNAIIDEVRISDAALTQDEFLFRADTALFDADFDDDGRIDGDDYLLWQRGFGGTGGATSGDADGDGQVTAADLDVWQTSFGGGPPLAAVPEPGNLAFLAAVATGCCQIRTLRRHEERRRSAPSGSRERQT